MPQVTVDDGVSLYFREVGEGERTVVLVHGWWLSGLLWEDVAPPLAKQGVRVLVPDLRGTGSSDKPSSGYSLERHARDIASLIEQVGGSDVVLVGHSLGGMYAQYVATAPPASVRGLALVCPLPADGLEVPEGIDLVFRAAATDPEARRTILTLATRTLSEARLEQMVQAGLTTDPRAFRSAFDTIQNARFAEKLGQIRLPTLVVSCDDAYMPDAVLRARVTARLPRAKQVLLPGSGHYVPLERPGELAAILGAFVAGLP